MALAPKSNASYRAIDAALADVEKGPSVEVPMHLRDRSYRGARELGRGEGYVYPHDHPEHAPEQAYLPENVADRRYFRPGAVGWEARAYLNGPRVRAEGVEDLRRRGLWRQGRLIHSSSVPRSGERGRT